MLFSFFFSTKVENCNLLYIEFIDAGREQRPQIRESLADHMISLHDDVMIDDPPGQEDVLNRVLTTYQQAHCKPATSFLSFKDEIQFLLKFIQLLQSPLYLEENTSLATNLLSWQN